MQNERGKRNIFWRRQIRIIRQTIIIFLDDCLTMKLAMSALYEE